MPDELWKTVERFLPPQPERKGPGRPRANDRAALNGVWYVLWRGCQWKAIQKSWFGVSSSVIHERFQTWREQGIFEAVMRETVMYLYISHIKHRRRRNEPVVEECPIPGE